ncbi:hypothetical protein TrLO_g9563 [Triparma laevis f. longispina]|uniref:J domain-containing protein n=1 Tax=Triparma laevis f. longispina TaxID=1714387 RepID=A0A9W6ZI32_9STRA|nr:hypothetical protein TrLO_g9563 [Triparma laevis f. longispina]
MRIQTYIRFFLLFLFLLPPSTSSTSPYAILHLPPTSTLLECKKSYLCLATRFHPDKGGDESEFRRIKKAYDDIKAERLSVNEYDKRREKRRRGRKRRRREKKFKNVGSYDLKNLFESFKH